MAEPHGGNGGLCEKAHVCPEHEGTDIRCGAVFVHFECGQVSCSPPEPTDVL